MALLDSIEKLGRAIFESSFTSGTEAPELAEIRLAVLDAAKARSHRAGSVRVLSDNVIRVRLRGIPDEQANAFESGVLADYLASALRDGLSRSSFRFPENLRVEVAATSLLPSPGQAWVGVETALEVTAPAPEQPKSQRTGRLVVLQGTANKPELALTKARTNVGRTVDVYQADGPVRRNDLAFTEDNEINRTVSREHAHILGERKSGEYRIFNDRWYKGANCGLWILRDGLSQPVHRGDRGLVLRSGDEIHAGRAIIKFLSR
ncbi:MAG: hypothetical protein JO307_31035 [Bryobacterales bacterium]|nr:hypothetical protein [Bryobacterales bacterium]MBV9399060.1 hypothetical protein [Bryobacterales bacterium]